MQRKTFVWRAIKSAVNPFTGLYLYTHLHHHHHIDLYESRFSSSPTVLSLGNAAAATYTRPVFITRPLANLHLPVSSAQLENFTQLSARRLKLERKEKRRIEEIMGNCRIYFSGDVEVWIFFLKFLCLRSLIAVLASEFLVLSRTHSRIVVVCVLRALNVCLCFHNRKIKLYENDIRINSTRKKKSSTHTRVNVDDILRRITSLRKRNRHK